MANIQMGQINSNFTSARKAVPGIDGTGNVTTPANYSSINAMRTRLAAAQPSYYTTAQLDAMTTNDMVYALRTIDDVSTIQ